MATNDNRDIIGPGHLQVYPGGVGTTPLPFLKSGALVEFILPSGHKVGVSIDKSGTLLVWTPNNKIRVAEHGDSHLRIEAVPR